MPGLLSAQCICPLLGALEDDCRFLVRASLCYFREGTRTSSLDVTTRAIQRAASSFRVLEPLRARVRIQHVATKLFTSIELVSNPFVPLVLVDSHVQWSERGHDASRLVVVETDHNTNVRGTRLCPNAELLLAFTLATSQSFNQAMDGWRGRLHVAPDDNGRHNLAGRSDGNTVPHRHWPRATYNDIFDTCVPDAVTFRLCVQKQMAQ
ncbi:hypothetical protein PsorP6_006329 [Peronosclerospora sorghi]|uniref:Uncharacterized protein n=1 Tax=Peronosclerospora sorghi TaxID=230839 RepID=A0ACC0W652_9STRA|nr:hypothetical protein PsorP6_006329 [Peronosclerospora sorghi]